jgi:hypothetical protein
MGPPKRHALRGGLRERARVAQLFVALMSEEHLDRTSGWTLKI